MNSPPTSPVAAPFVLEAIEDDEVPLSQRSTQEEEPSAFDFNAKRVFLTYSRCDIEPRALYDAIHAKFPIAGATIGQEEHKDGAPHLHAVVCFERRVHSRDPRCFDVAGFHPNIRKVSLRDDDLFRFLSDRVSLFQAFSHDLIILLD